MAARDQLSPSARNWTLAAGGAAALPLLLQIPTGLALGLAFMGLLTAWSGRRRWPAVLRMVVMVGLVALVLLSFQMQIGRDSGSALLLAMVMLKPAELSSARDARSLLGFSLFAPFAAVLNDQGPLTTLLGLAAIAMQFAAFGRLQEEATSSPPIRPRARVAQALVWLALAVPIAVPAFIFLPRLPSPLWGMPDRSSARTGIAERMSPGDWIDLLVDDSPAFRVSFRGPMPPPEERYWRGLVLWDFDGRTWTRNPSQIPEGPVAIRYRGNRLEYELTLEPSERTHLFALDLLQGQPLDTRLGSDHSLTSITPIRTVRRFSLASAPAASFEPELPPRTRFQALRLPADFNPRARALAEGWRARARSDEEVVGLALEMFREDFEYSLSPPPLGRHSVDEFLFTTREGFCEHYSSAFTFLMRAAGIPSRIVIGYVGGFRNPVGDYLLVRQSDAHAWAEVWLEDRGWVRVDPTAVVSPGDVLGRRGAAVADAGAGATRRFWHGAAQLADWVDWARSSWNQVLVGYDAARQRMLLRPLGVERGDTLQLGLLFGAVTALGLLVAVLLLLRVDRPVRDPVLVAYQAMLKRLERRGLRKPPSQPPLDFGQAAARAFPDDAGRLLSLSRRFSDWRYAPEGSGEDGQRALIRDLRAFRPSRRALPGSGDSP